MPPFFFVPCSVDAEGLFGTALGLFGFAVETFSLSELAAVDRTAASVSVDVFTLACSPVPTAERRIAGGVFESDDVASSVPDEAAPNALQKMFDSGTPQASSSCGSVSDNDPGPLM